jgi:hypothetical protein
LGFREVSRRVFAREWLQTQDNDLNFAPDARPLGNSVELPNSSGIDGLTGRLQSARQTKTVVVVTVVGLIVVPNRGPAIVLVIVPRPATQNAALTTVALLGIRVQGPPQRGN